jgi:DNA-binding PadR family transcriptional regulator
LTVLKNGTVEKLRKQNVKAVLDTVLLAELRHVNMSGYDAIGFIHNKFCVLVSSGTVYSHLYALEREGLIHGEWDTKKRVYDITEKGEQLLESILNSNMELLTSLKNISTV